MHTLRQKDRLALQKKHIGFVFQSYHLLDNLTVYENLEVPLSYRDVPRSQRQSIVSDTLDRFQIVAKKDLYPSQLSGGQQQLVGVARAVVASPGLILADEPTGNLHSDQAREIMELFKKLNNEGTTIIQVTHSEVNAQYREPRHQAARRVDCAMTASRGIGLIVPSRVPRVLLADDQRDILEALQLLLKSEGFQVQCVTSPAAVLAAIAETDFDAALIDLNYARDTTSGQEGLDLLARLQSEDPMLPVIVLTAWASVDVAVEAMRRGARDFVQKPWDNARLLAIVRTQVELSRALRRGRQLEGAARLSFDGAPPLIARSPAMKPVIELIERTAPSDANVLITGENGTGKGLVAQAIHALSPRAARPMVTVNAGGVSETVFESELFGHVRGAFTDARADRVGRFELADGGTLFLDEIANVPPSQQAKLLRVIAAGEFERLGSSRTRRVDVRILSATNADIDAEVAAGRFRQDLLFRLNTIEIVLPPLRDRRDDIPSLATHFLEQHARRYRKNLTGFDSAAMEALLRHPWPGNVRELEHAIERSVLMAAGPTVATGDLGLRRTQDGAQSLENMGLEDVEAFLIRKAVSRYGSVTDAAKALGLSRSALYRRLERYGIEP